MKLVYLGVLLAPFIGLYVLVSGAKSDIAHQNEVNKPVKMALIADCVRDNKDYHGPSFKDRQQYCEYLYNMGDLK